MYWKPYRLPFTVRVSTFVFLELVAILFLLPAFLPGTNRETQVAAKAVQNPLQETLDFVAHVTKRETAELPCRQLKDGTLMMELGDSFQHVALFRADTNGRISVRCVGSVAEAEAFLRGGDEATDRQADLGTDRDDRPAGRDPVLLPFHKQAVPVTDPASQSEVRVENPQGSTIIIRNVNEPGVGLNDPTPVTPVGGNLGTTLGQQRLNVFQRAAEIWGATLRSDVPIVVEARFTSLPSGVLGSAGTTSIFRSFPNAPFGETWYHYPLANALAGRDLLAQDPPRAQINVNLSTNPNFYLGLDNNAPSDQVDLLTVILHELAHGLGFSTFVNTANGRNAGADDINPDGGFTDCYARFLRDETLNLTWNQMTAVQRQASAINTGNLTWSGPTTQSALPVALAPSPTLRIERTPPVIIAVNQATFGGSIPQDGLTRPLVAAQPPLACGPLSNPGAVNTNFALVDRGDCPFIDKAANVQQAGAQGLIIANNTTGGFVPGGTAPNITIPVVGISQEDGATLRGFLASGNVTATLFLDPTRLSGTTNGRIRMFSPNPRQAGSSVSHWDNTVRPRLLMEPAITPRLPRTQDLTLNLFRDLGWTVNPLFSLSELRVPAGGAAQQVTINAVGAWTVAGLPDWITGFPTAGNLLTNVNFQVAPNPGSERVATLALNPGGNTLTIVQNGAGDTVPSFTSPSSVTFTLGQPSSFIITATGTPAPTITLVSGNLPAGVRFIGGIGTATLVGTPEAGTSGTYFLLVRATNSLGSATQNISLRIGQGLCAFTVAPTVLNVGGEAVNNVTLSVITGPNCAWEARVRNIDAPWIKLISAQLANGQVVTPRMVDELGREDRRLVISGIGSATLTIGVGRNSRSTSRTGTFVVAGQVITVRQAGFAGVGLPLGVTMAMFRPSNGYMYLKNRLISDFADQDFFYGTAGDVPIAGDWDGDGVDTPGVYRNVNGTMTFFLIDNNTGGFADVSFAFGQPGDLPIAGDWDGNGTVTCGVYRPGSRAFFLRNVNAAGSPDLVVAITGAEPSDRPIAGRWNPASTVTGLGLYRPRESQFLLKNTNTSGPPDAVFTLTTTGTPIAPVAGDWTLRGFAAVGVVVNLGGTVQFQLRNSNTSGPPEIRINYGAPGDVPLIGNWDGLPKLPPVSVP